MELPEVVFPNAAHEGKTCAISAEASGIRTPINDPVKPSSMGT